MSPATSTDPVVLRALGHLERINSERTAIEALLAAYCTTNAATEHLPALMPKPLLGHYPMLEAVECGCDLCLDWAQRRSELQRAMPFVPRDHRYHTCDCRSCAFVKRCWMNYQAAANRRDLLIGASFHAYHNSPYGAQVMAWFEVEISDTRRTINWWALEGGRYPTAYWLRRCQMSLGPVLSGVVFDRIEF